jgi:hypothetical protein
MAVKEQVVFKLDIDHIIWPEHHDEIFVGLDAEEPVFYEEDEIDIYYIICLDCPSIEVGFAGAAWIVPAMKWVLQVLMST